MSEAIRAGVIGFGLGGRVFHAAYIDAVQGLELAAIAQRSGNDVAEAYPNVRVVRSLPELLEDETIRLVAVATGNNTHYKLARQCLEAGRNVVVDKPLTLTSTEAAELIVLARDRNLVLSAYQNRRWDGDFKTVAKLLRPDRGDYPETGSQLGRLVSFESHFDRFRQEIQLQRWKESGEPGGGVLYDLGPHLIDQALSLFGTPEWVEADVRIDREGGLTEDAFDIRLSYSRLTVWLRSTLTAAIPGARFLLHGTEGSFVKYGLDPQENAVRSGAKIGAKNGALEWGEEPEEAWGTLKLAGGSEQRVRTEPGDYRAYYENVRDALLGRASLAVPAIDAWRTARIIELARQSSTEKRSLRCELGALP